MAVEDVVGGYLDEGGAAVRAGVGEVADRAPVDGEGLVFACLRVVDRRPGGAVDDDVGLVVFHRGRDGRGVGDVKAGPVQPDDLIALGAEQAGQVAAEHPVGPGDQPPAHDAGRCGGAGRSSGSHHGRFSAYQAMVALRPSANGTRGA